MGKLWTEARIVAWRKRVGEGEFDRVVEKGKAVTTGVYRWLNLTDGKMYVGGAYKRFERREYIHRRDLRGGGHWNRHLQNAWNRDGEESFVFQILERCPPEDVRACEQKWLDRTGAAVRSQGYNLTPTAGTMTGFSPSEETRKLWSKQRKGRKQSPETVAKIVAANRGRKRSPEFCELMRRMATGRKHTPETCAKMSASHKGIPLGREHRENLAKVLRSDEVRAKISASCKGRRHTEEAKAKIRAALFGRTISEETRIKLRGLRHSDEAKEKIAAAARKQWQNEEHRRTVSKKISATLMGHKLSPESLANEKAAGWLNSQKQECCDAGSGV